MSDDEYKDVLIEAGVKDEPTPKKRGRPPKVASKPVSDISTDENLLINAQRQKLCCVIASGQSKMFLGKAFTIQEIEAMSHSDITKYCKYYESTYSKLISDEIVTKIIDVSSKIFSIFLPIDDCVKLSQDFKNDFLLTNAMRNLTGQIAYNYGPILALTSGSLTLGKHIKIKPTPDISKHEVKINPVVISTSEKKVIVHKPCT